ncbi:MAG: shikimate dehydrogenase [Deltaproteobacteria bacterium]|nr:shikimate dehydrogenase [Deltaproteobacteria bacterium]
MKSKKNLKILGLIGDPIAHSLSPVMQNAALAHLRLPYLYMPFEVKPEFLEHFMGSLTSRKIAGLNVTIPHKQAVMPFLDSLTQEARTIGAVNTIKIIGGKLKGHNTDGAGFVASLWGEAGFSPKKAVVILLGAGGAARAIAASLGQARAREVLLINRTAKKAFDLAHEMGKKFPRTTFSVGSFARPEPYFWASADLLVNASSLGMKGKKGPPLPLSKLSSRALVSDIVYAPLETPLLKKAKKLGLKTHPGWGMLLYQGALSFEFWTGKKAPLKVMRETLLDSLKQMR